MSYVNTKIIVILIGFNMYMSLLYSGQNYQYNPWLIHLAVKLLDNDEETTTLIANNPFRGREPPR